MTVSKITFHSVTLPYTGFCQMKLNRQAAKVIVSKSSQQPSPGLKLSDGKSFSTENKSKNSRRIKDAKPTFIK